MDKFIKISKSQKSTSKVPADNIGSKASRPKIPSNKYLRRALLLNQDEGESLIKLNIKRYHIRKINEVKKFTGYEEQTSLDLKKLEKRHHKCLNKGHFKTLASLKICTSFHKYLLKDLKASKRLAKLDCEPYETFNPRPMIKFFQRVSKSVEVINFSIGYYYDISENVFMQLSKAIGRFPRLRVFQGEEKTTIDGQLTTPQWRYLYQHQKRSSHLQDVDCFLSNRTDNTPWILLNHNKAYPKVIKLRVYLLGDFQSLENRCAQNLSHVFPNLKQLEFIDDNKHKSYQHCHPLIALGFKNLQCLQKLTLRLDFCEEGTFKDNVVLKALLDLPKLSSLDLSFFTFSSDEWKTFLNFLENQTDLVSLKFGINCFWTAKEKYQTLENLFISLKKMSKLQYFNLNADCWPLEYLSKGLKNLVGSVQLKSFELHGQIYQFTSTQTEQHPFEAFCQFLLRNKTTLSELRFHLPLMADQKLSTALSQLSQLKKLWLTFSVWESTEKVYQKGDPNLNSVLLNLEKLEDLTLDFRSLEKFTLEERKWMRLLFKALPSFKRLRNFNFYLPHRGLSKTEVTYIQSAIKQLGHLNNINFLDSFQNAMNTKILESIENLGLKKATHVNLPF